MLSPRIKCRPVISNEVRSDKKRLRDSFRLRLHRVFEADSELRTVSQKVAQHREIFRRRDNENLAQATEHEGGERDNKSSACRRPAAVACRRSSSADKGGSRRRRRVGLPSCSCFAGPADQLLGPLLPETTSSRPLNLCFPRQPGPDIVHGRFVHGLVKDEAGTPISQ